MAEIFLSYAHEDHTLAVQLVKALKERGLEDLWWDHEILAGDHWRPDIEQKIKDASCMVVLWSRHSVDRPFVRAEAERGFDILVPIQIDSADLPLPFNEVHTTDFTGWNGDVTAPAFVELAKAISKKLKAKRENPRVPKPGAAALESFLQPACRSRDAGSRATPPTDRLASDLTEFLEQCLDEAGTRAWIALPPQLGRAGLRQHQSTVLEAVCRCLASADPPRPHHPYKFRSSQVPEAGALLGACRSLRDELHQKGASLLLLVLKDEERFRPAVHDFLVHSLSELGISCLVLSSHLPETDLGEASAWEVRSLRVESVENLWLDRRPFGSYLDRIAGLNFNDLIRHPNLKEQLEHQRQRIQNLKEYGIKEIGIERFINGGIEAGDVFKFLPEILDNRDRIFFLLGEAGQGKTSICRFLIYTLVEQLRQEYQPAPPLPIFLPFNCITTERDLANPQFFREIFKDLDERADDVAALIERGEAFLIFDGLDENTLGLSVEDILATLRRTYPRCPMLVTSRSHFFQANSAALDVPGFCKLYLKPLTEEQQKVYLQRRLPRNLAESTLEMIHQQDLFRLAPIPFLLEMIAQIVEKEGISEGFRDGVHRVDLYRQFVDGWCAEERGHGVGLDRGHVRFYLQLTSLMMFQQSNSMEVIRAPELNQALRRQGYEESAAARICSAMVNLFRSPRQSGDGGEVIALSHRSMLEFLVAESILSSICPLPNQQSTPEKEPSLLDKLTPPLTHEILGFIQELIDSRQDAPVGGRHDIRNGLLIQIDQLDKSAEDLETARAVRCNLLRILAYIHQFDLSLRNPEFNDDQETRSLFSRLFAGRNFTGIDLRLCDLSGHDLQGTVLHKAILREITLSQCNLAGTDLRDSDLTGVYFGQSMAVWTLAYAGAGKLALNLGDGQPGLLDTATRPQVRTVRSSARCQMIWRLALFPERDPAIAFCCHHYGQVSVLDLRTGGYRRFKISDPRRPRQTLYGVAVSSRRGIAVFAGSNRRLYITHIAPLLADLSTASDEQVKELPWFYPPSYHDDQHEDSIFAVGFTSDDDYLVSCSADRTIRLWPLPPVERPDAEWRLDRVSSPSVEVSKLHPGQRNAIRSLEIVHHRGSDYCVAGTQLGWLTVYRVAYDSRRSASLEHVVTLNQDCHTDWVLGLHAFRLEGALHLATVSGDQTACIYRFDDLLDRRSAASPRFRGRHRSSLLSVASDGGPDHDATVLFLGTYDGAIIEQSLSGLIGGSAWAPQSDRTWTPQDIIARIDRLPESYIADASLAQISGVIGVNEGRMALLRERGALDWSLPSKFDRYQELFLDLRSRLIREQQSCRVFLHGVWERKTWSRGLEEYLAELRSGTLERLSGLFLTVNSEIDKLRDPELCASILETYRTLFQTKVTLAGSLLVLYWLSRSTWRSARRVALSDLHELHDRLLALPPTFSHDCLPRPLHDHMVNGTRDALKEMFLPALRTDRLFEICQEDYHENAELRSVLDFLAGAPAAAQIPTALPGVKISDLWAELNNAFWNSGAEIAQTYFNTFQDGLYRCCGQAQHFLQAQIVAALREQLALNPESRLRYLDLATGFNGTIACGVYEALEDAERERVLFTASDADPNCVAHLRESCLQKGLAIVVRRENMSDPDVEPETLAVVSQAVGGHHVQAQRRHEMYKRLAGALIPGGTLAVADVAAQPLKILACLGDDLGAPEDPYDCRLLDELFPNLGLSRTASGRFPELWGGEGFYTAATFRRLAG
jgi:WD40 repeat protein